MYNILCFTKWRFIQFPDFLSLRSYYINIITFSICTYFFLFFLFLLVFFLRITIMTR